MSADMALAFTLETTGVRIGPDDMEATARGDYRVPPPQVWVHHLHHTDNIMYGHLNDLSYPLVNLDGHPIKNRQTMRVSGCTWMGWTPSN